MLSMWLQTYGLLVIAGLASMKKAIEFFDNGTDYSGVNQSSRFLPPNYMALNESLIFKLLNLPKYINICKTLPFKQVIKRKGCLPVIFRNQMCIGKCYPSIKSQLNMDFPSHRSCIPSKSKFVRVKQLCSLRAKM